MYLVFYHFTFGKLNLTGQWVWGTCLILITGHGVITYWTCSTCFLGGFCSWIKEGVKN